MSPIFPDLQERLSGCRGALIDSNILLDVVIDDPQWGEWSGRALAEMADHAVLIVNPIVYAEVSVGFANIEELDAVLPTALYRRDPLPWEAAFLAGKCFLQYRRRGGQRRSPLPDFYIGAHAAVERLGLLTRDPARYQSYFPTVELFAPGKHRTR
jgi:predicted nucleic acid-binding protein